MQRGVSGAAADGKCSVAVVKGCGFPLNLFMACAWCASFFLKQGAGSLCHFGTLDFLQLESLSSNYCWQTSTYLKCL